MDRRSTRRNENHSKKETAAAALKPHLKDTAACMAALRVVNSPSGISVEGNVVRHREHGLQAHKKCTLPAVSVLTTGRNRSTIEGTRPFDSILQLKPVRALKCSTVLWLCCTTAGIKGALSVSPEPFAIDTTSKRKKKAFEPWRSFTGDLFTPRRGRRTSVFTSKHAGYRIRGRNHSYPLPEF